MEKRSVPKEWEIKKLDDYIVAGEIELSRGNVISKKDIANNPGPNPIYSSSIHNDALFGTYGDYMFDEELITWSVDGGGNFFYRPKHKFSVTNVSGILRANTKKFNYHFLAYLLELEHRKFHFDYQTKAHPSVIRKLYFITRPPLLEQQKIAEILETLDKEIEQTTQIIVATEKMQMGLMQHLFTHGIGHLKFQKTEIGEIPKEWKVERLDKVARVERGKFSNRPRNDPKFYGGDIPFIQTGDVVRSGGRIKKYSQTLNEDGLAISRKFSKGTIVLTIAANIGDTGILEFDSCFPDSLVGITVNNDMDNIFLEYFMRTRKVYLNSIATQSAQKNINLQKLEPMLVVKPGLKEQREIAVILTSVDEKISVNERLKAGLTLLKRGLMQDLLSGKKRTV
ncbi:MAG: Uncharacterized protein G01um101420_799 [Parcubacteria group bacterium Gr01-1014_20]|nr:MAG: Uncharacterized protein G01um101420_799 [Parcubacteria group bacterium Gr01-1014_20]